MYKELRKKAKKKVEAKLAFYTCTIVFFFVTVILIMLSFYLPSVSFWLRLPIPIFMMVLGILYIIAFGPPFRKAYSGDWQEEEIEREMVRLFREKRAHLPPLEELSETEVLELKKLDRLHKKWDWGDDFV